jgi:Tol biopolymer transport system component/tRNA A-37 threonylcarbamoyl transferase component Bud32
VPQAGQRLDHYEIIAQLGEGGMGTVFKARDTRLNRLVALKTLRPEFVSDPNRRARFTQEAKSASALNHPGIVHIYDIDRSGDIDYIVMEYVQGKTLHELVHGKPLAINDASRYAVQLADALEAAHSAGIIHRDLKPANIMITDRGLVKVLDFGLAKLTETIAQDDMTRTIDHAGHTAEGMAVGTVAYMSPEQAQGLRLDARSDIFSFGMVLYEMVTGARPFQGGSALLTLTAILRDAPKAPSQLAPDVPRELEDIILRCMRKDREQRFQHMSEIKVTLESFNREPIFRRRSIFGRGSNLRLTRAAAAVVLGSLVLIGGAAGVWWWLNGAPKAPGELGLMRLSSESGLTMEPAISPDGKLLAFASDRAGEGNLDIWVQQTDGGQAIRLTKDPADDESPSFSPDGTRIAFRSTRDGGGIYIIATLGGQESKIADNGRQPRFSPDGKQIAYWVGPPAQISGAAAAGKLYVVDAAGGPPRRLVPGFSSAANAIWTMDGKKLLFQGVKDALRPETFGWWVAPIDGGEAVKVGAPPVLAKLVDQWSPFGFRGDRVVFTSATAEERKAGLQIIQEVGISPKSWQITGEPHRLTAGTTRAESPSISLDGRLIFASVTSNLDVYLVPVNANRGNSTGPLQRITRDLGDDSGPSLSQDGTRLAYRSFGSGSPGMWMKDLGTGQEKLLMRPGFPLVSPDGSTLAWAEAGKIFVAPFGGGPIREICSACGLQQAWSPDGKKILYFESTHVSVRLLDVNSGETTEYLKGTPRSISPDGKWIAFEGRMSDGRAGPVIAPFRATPPPESEWILAAKNANMPRWSPDGSLLYFLSTVDGFLCIWAQRLDAATKHPSGEPFAVAHFHATSLRMRGTERWLSVARDKLAFCLEERTGNLWMLRPER